jgi:hypothetical protein
VKLSEALYFFVNACVSEDISFELYYETGRYIPGIFINLPYEEQMKHVVQGPKGYRVEVGGTALLNEHEEEELYPDLMAAVNAGFRLLKHARDKDEDEK